MVEWDEPDFGGWVRMMGKGEVRGARAVVVLNVWKVWGGCGLVFRVFFFWMLERGVLWRRS